MITEDIRELRKTGIGGSDIGAIMGLSDFSTPRKVYLAKTSDVDTPVNTEAVYWGTVLEDVIIDRYTEQHPDVTVERSPEMFRHMDNEWMIANLDGIIYEGDRQGVLEIKTASTYSGSKWGTEGTDEIPPSYAAQVRWYMAVMDMDYAIVAVLIGGQDYREYRVDRDLEIEAQMIEAGRKFWFDYVKKGIEPPPLNDDEAVSIYSESEPSGEEIQADTGVFDTYLKLREIKDEIKKLSEEAKDYEKAIKIRLGDASALSYEGKPIVTWYQREKTSFDQKGFQKEYPELYEKFSSKTSSRTFLVK